MTLNKLIGYGVLGFCLLAGSMLVANNARAETGNINFSATKNGSPYFGTGAVFSVVGVGEFRKQQNVSIPHGNHKVILTLDGKPCGTRKFTAGTAQHTITINCEG